VTVDRGALGHAGFDVGDGNENLDGAARQLFRHRELVEIAGIVVVDRGPKEVPEIANGGPGLGDCFRDRLRLRGHSRGKIRQQSSLDHRATCDGAELVSIRR
jgi:hypothetical protein